MEIRDIINDKRTVKVNQMVQWFTFAEVSHFRWQVGTIGHVSSKEKSLSYQFCFKRWRTKSGWVPTSSINKCEIGWIGRTWLNRNNWQDLTDHRMLLYYIQKFHVRGKRITKSFHFIFKLFREIYTIQHNGDDSTHAKSKWKECQGENIFSETASNVRYSALWILQHF